MAHEAAQQRKTLDQRRAAHAWKVIQKVKALPEDAQKEFAIQVKRLSARILTSGLGQTMVFLKAKGYAEPLRRALSDWILGKRYSPDAPEPENPDELLQAIVNGTAEFLRLATDEALAYAQWLARFADAEGLKGGD